MYPEIIVLLNRRAGEPDCANPKLSKNIMS